VTRLTGTRIWRHCRSAVVDKCGSESHSSHPRSCMYMSRLGIHNDVLLLHMLPLQSMCSWSYFCFGTFQLYIFALKFQMPCISRWHLVLKPLLISLYHFTAKKTKGKILSVWTIWHLYWNLYSSVYTICEEKSYCHYLLEICLCAKHGQFDKNFTNVIFN
jgi:hypothetical protein